MPATCEERLAELVSAARHVGYLEAEANHAEHAADTAPINSGRLRRKATEARKLAVMWAEQLEKMHARFLGGAS